MSDHPLYFQPVTLNDGRTGTVVEVYGDGEAFMVELTGATDLEDLIIVYPVAGGLAYVAGTASEGTPWEGEG